MTQGRSVNTIAKSELQESAKSILIGLHLLNLREPFECLPARNVRVENRPPQNLISVEPATSRKGLELLYMLVTQTNRDSVLEPLRSPHGFIE